MDGWGVMFLTFWSVAGSPGMSSGPFLGVYGSERFAKAADTGSEELRRKSAPGTYHVAQVTECVLRCDVVCACVGPWGQATEETAV